MYQRPTYGRESDDLYYPLWFDGEWAVKSGLSAVVAPLGQQMFGSGAYKRALEELNAPPLAYRARWLKAPGERSCISDRPYNVASISRAAMGPEAVLSSGGGRSGASPFDQSAPADVLELRIAPAAAGGRVFRCIVEVTGRVSRETSPRDFECAEFVRQTVVPERSNSGPRDPANPVPQTPTLVKEIETISTFRLEAGGTITSKQRTSTFLVADAAYTQPGADLRESLVRARSARDSAVDVRVYSVTYRKD